jgi:hypothetical protein
LFPLVWHESLRLFARGVGTRQLPEQPAARQRRDCG